MLIDRRLPLPIHGSRVLSQEPADGDLGGIFTAIGLGAGALIATLFGGGLLWTKHEELELEEEFNRWREIYQNPPYNMTPQEAIAAARGVVPSQKGFEFGLNVPTAIIIGGGLFALYVGSQVVVKWLSPGKK